MARKRLFSRICPAFVPLLLTGLALLATGQECLFTGTGAGAPVPLAVEAGPNGAITLGSGFLLQGAASGGVTPYTYAWSPAAGLNNASLPQPTFTPTGTGTFSFVLTVNDGAGQVASDTVTVVVNPAGGGDGGGGGGGDGDGDGDGDGTGAPARLVANAGPDRTATTGSPITIQGFVSGGDGNYTIAWSPATALSRADTLTPSFTPAGGGAFTFTLNVTDGAGSTASDSMKVTVSDKTTLSTLRWAANYPGDGYQALAEFTRALEPVSAGRETNYRISGSGTNPATVELSDGDRVAILTFTNVALTSETALDISVDDAIKDTNGNKVPETKGLVPLANAGDTKAPTVVADAVKWAVDYAGSYALDLAFSESMDRTSVESPAAYRVKDGDTLLTAYSATLAGNGRTVTLVFEGKPLSIATKLDVGLAPLKLKDINGQVLATASDVVIKSNAADVTAPTVVENSIRFVGDVTQGGYQVRLDFSEAMDKATAQTAQAYKVDATAAKTAELGEDGRRVLLTFDQGTASTASKLDITASTVKDINGKAVAAQTGLKILASEATGASPGAPTLTWLKGTDSNGYQLRARFNEAMDKTTVEDPDNWRINGTTIKPTAVVLDNVTQGEKIAGRTATITFGNFGTSTTRMSVTTKLDLSIDREAPIRDVTGNELESLVLPILPNTSDNTPPTVTGGPVWGDLTAGGYTGDKYLVSVDFSETMDAQSARNRENYLLAGVNPTSVTLDATGRRVVLTFATTLGGIAGGPSGDTLRVYSSVRDINGRPTSSVVAMAIQPNTTADTTAPQVVEVFWGINKAPYTVNVVFNEVMDADSAANVHGYALAGAEPTQVTLSPDGKTVILEFGSGAFATSALLAIDVPGGANAYPPADVNGNAYTGGGMALPAPPSQRTQVDREAPELVSAVWGADWDGYVVIAEFNEAVDALSAGATGAYSLAGELPSGFPGDVFADSVTVLDGGTYVALYFTGLFERQAKLTAGNFFAPILDVHGNASIKTTPVLANPADRAARSLLEPEVWWTADYGAPGSPTEDVSEGYQLMVTFSREILDQQSAENPSNYSISGTSIKPATAVLVSPAMEAADPELVAGMSVVLTFGSPRLTRSLGVEDTLDVSVGSSISDLNGRFFAPILELTINANSALDQVIPFVEQASASGAMATVVFSEAMDRTSAQTLENYLFVVHDDPLAPPEEILDGQGNPIGVPLYVLLDKDGRTATVLCQKLIDVATMDLMVSMGNSITDVNLRPVQEIRIALPYTAP